jgi:hypothetical protein
MAHGQHVSRTLRATHRVALELEVVEDPDAAEPEDWDLEHLEEAVRVGVARPVRTIQGRVIDSEHDRLSRTLDVVADDLDEAVQLHWMASARRWPSIAWSLRPRPSIETLIELERLAAAVHDMAGRLKNEGL